MYRSRCKICVLEQGKLDSVLGPQDILPVITCLGPPILSNHPFLELPQVPDNCLPSQRSYSQLISFRISTWAEGNGNDVTLEV